MEHILGFIVSISILASHCPLTESAAPKSRQLLKYYPINEYQYNTLSNLIKQQQHPVVAENVILAAGHRSLAEWSESMPSGWNNIFNMNVDQQRNNSYPLCLLQSNGTTRRRKRNDESTYHDFAGVAPNVVYTVPSPQEFPQAYYAEHVYEQPQHVYGQPQFTFDSKPHITGHVISVDNNKKEDPKAVVNCVVVLRSVKAATTTTTTTPRPHTYPPHGYPPNGYPPHGYPPHGYPPHGYPPHAYPPHGYPPHGYPPHGYPPHGYPYPLPPYYPYPTGPPYLYSSYPASPLETTPSMSSINPPEPSLRTNLDTSNTLTNTAEEESHENMQYRQMLTKYYQELAKLYSANAMSQEEIIGEEYLKNDKDNINFDDDEDDYEDFENNDKDKEDDEN